MTPVKLRGRGTLPETDPTSEEPIRLKVADPHAKPKLRKRVYETVSVVDTGDGFGVALDDRQINTPGRVPLLVGSKGLAEAIAQEWDDQTEEIDPSTMPLSKLANTALDRVAPSRDAIVADLLRYVDTDLLCYRADSPEALADRQAAVWQPILDWLTATHDVTLQVGTGLMPLSQSNEAVTGMEQALSACDDVVLTAAQAGSALTGSVVLGLAIAQGRLSGSEAFAASQLDETWQLEQWGEDQEAVERRTQLEADLSAVERFVTLTR